MFSIKEEIEIADDLQEASHHCEDNIEFNHSHIVLPSERVYGQIARLYVGSYISVHFYDLSCIQLYENAASSLHLA